MAVRSVRPFVSVIILNYNGQASLGALLGECLKSVFSADYSNFEVLFVDNGSTDGSVRFVKEVFGKEARLQIIQNTRNLGFTEGNNVGIRRARGKLIALLNSDTKVDSNWLNKLVEAVAPADVGTAQSKLINLNDPRVLDCAGGFVDYYGYHFELGRGEESFRYSRNAEIFYAKGAAVIFKGEALAKAGLFDPEIYLYFDETDMCWRIRLAGYKVILAANSIVYHGSGLTASKFQYERRQFFYTRNHLMVLLKNYGLRNLFGAVAVSVLYEARNAVLSLIRHRPLVALSIVRA